MKYYLPWMSITNNNMARVRILTAFPFEEETVHWVVENGSKRRRLCRPAPAFCTYCEQGNSAVTRWKLVCLRKNGTETRIHNWEIGKAIFNNIKSYHDDYDWGDVRGYDLLVSREGFSYRIHTRSKTLCELGNNLSQEHRAIVREILGEDYDNFITG